jgi:signal transduction histidine kinase
LKLVTKINITFIIAAVIISLVACVIFYYTMTSMINEETNERLYYQKEYIKEKVSEGISLPEILNELHSRIEFTKIDVPVEEKLTDTVLYDISEQDVTPFRQLRFSISSKGEIYEVSVYASLIESDDLIESIINALAPLFVILIAISFLVNYLSFRNTWKPFYNTIDEIKKYNLSKGDKINLEKSGTDEFNKLNKVLNSMTKKIRDDYENLKNFTQNASHELQTPLAIIQAKLESLAQSEKLDEERAYMIASLQESVRRLSKLNKNLLLLTKIENNQFPEIGSVNICKLIREKLEIYNSIYPDKKLGIELNIQDNFMLEMNPYLAEVLFSNLISNSMKHNITGGNIILELQDGVFTITNSSNVSYENTSELFERFKKSDPSAESTGLGLSLVKDICALYEYSISYKSEKNRHNISIKF